MYFLFYLAFIISIDFGIMKAMQQEIFSYRLWNAQLSRYVRSSRFQRELEYKYQLICLHIFQEFNQRNSAYCLESFHMFVCNQATTLYVLVISPSIITSRTKQKNKKTKNAIFNLICVNDEFSRVVIYFIRSRW